MVNIRTLLTKILESIKDLLDWKAKADPIIWNRFITDGQYVTSSFSSSNSVSVQTTTYTNLLQITLPFDGKWLISCRCRYASNATGRRYLFVGENSAASNTWVSSCQAVDGGTTNFCFTVAASYSNTPTNIYLVAYHSAGQNLSVTTAALTATYIGEVEE